MHNCTGCICSFYFSSVCCQMYPQIACSNGYIFTQVAFSFTFLLCAFSNVSSNCLQKRMQSHTGCICLTFLHCLFSNVSSNRLPERMHKHTGCICLTFLQCVFSYGLEENSGQCMWSHTGYICLTFLHCVYSNVSSNCLPEMMHNHTGCICWTFPHRVFSHEPSNCFCKRTHNCAGCICSTLRDLYSFPWGFPHFVCSSLDFQVFPFPLSPCTGYFLILRQIWPSGRFKISVEKWKWNCFFKTITYLA